MTSSMVRERERVWDENESERDSRLEVSELADGYTAGVIAWVRDI